MKGKRYFFKILWAPLSARGNKLFALIMVISLIIIPISSFIIYNIAYDYDDCAYDRLDEIANSVINIGEGIDLSAMPDDVVNYQITGNDEGIIFEYSLDDNVNMTINLSEDYNIISKETDYMSQNGYNNKMIVISVFHGVVVWAFCLALGGIGCFAAGLVSYLSYLWHEKDLS